MNGVAEGLSFENRRQQKRNLIIFSPQLADGDGDGDGWHKYKLLDR